MAFRHLFVIWLRAEVIQPTMGLDSYAFIVGKETFLFLSCIPSFQSPDYSFRLSLVPFQVFWANYGTGHELMTSLQVILPSLEFEGAGMASLAGLVP